NAELIIAGRGAVDDPLLAGYRGSFVHLPDVGAVELVTLYQQADIFCLPSMVEGFGLVILEALACGTPVITTTHTAGADIATQGQTGFVLEPGDQDALTRYLLWCYEPRSTDLAAMRGACRALAERYAWQVYRARLAHGIADCQNGVARHAE